MGSDNWDLGILETQNFSLREVKFEMEISRAFFENANFYPCIESY